MGGGQRGPCACTWPSLWAVTARNTAPRRLLRARRAQPAASPPSPSPPRHALGFLAPSTHRGCREGLRARPSAPIQACPRARRTQQLTDSVGAQGSSPLPDTLPSTLMGTGLSPPPQNQSLNLAVCELRAPGHGSQAPVLAARLGGAGGRCLAASPHSPSHGDTGHAHSCGTALEYTCCPQCPWTHRNTEGPGWPGLTWARGTGHQRPLPSRLNHNSVLTWGPRTAWPGPGQAEDKFKDGARSLQGADMAPALLGTGVRADKREENMAEPFGGRRPGSGEPCRGSASRAPSEPALRPG